jgi:hypothetical protein
MRSILSAAMVLFGCSGSGFVEPAAGDATSDSTTAADTSRDTSVADTTTAADTTTPPVDAGPCVPFWCGCGECVAADIVCTRSPTGCPLGCPSAPCPAMEKEGLCTSSGDRCVRNGIDGPIACLSNADCPPSQCCSGTFTPPAHGTCGGC